MAKEPDENRSNRTAEQSKFSMVVRLTDSIKTFLNFKSHGQKISLGGIRCLYR
jgi:hypothetical protein